MTIIYSPPLDENRHSKSRHIPLLVVCINQSHWWWWGENRGREPSHPRARGWLGKQLTVHTWVPKFEPLCSGIKPSTVTYRSNPRPGRDWWMLQNTLTIGSNLLNEFQTDERLSFIKIEGQWDLGNETWDWALISTPRSTHRSIHGYIYIHMKNHILGLPWIFSQRRHVCKMYFILYKCEK